MLLWRKGNVSVLYSEVGGSNPLRSFGRKEKDMMSYFKERDMQELVGRTIRRILIGDSEYQILFQMEDYEPAVSYVAMGDCCSVSWFADLTGVDALLGGTVASVEEVELEDYDTEDGRGRQEWDRVYGFKITTDKGYATLAFRNSSNGYYGGWLERTEEYGNPKDYREIKEDWSA